MTKIKAQYQTIVKKHGYEYILVEGSDRRFADLPQPCFMGLPGMALKGCRKIGEEPKKKKLTYTQRTKILKNKDIEL